MAYPANYGYFPGTLGDDGDPLDCVVVCNAPLRPGVLIEVRPIGALLMEDQAGGDEKIICVPRDKIDPYYEKIEFIEHDNDSLDDLYNVLMENGIEVVAEASGEGEGPKMEQEEENLVLSDEEITKDIREANSAEKMAQNKNIEKIQLECFKSNQKGLNFYKNNFK